MYVFLYWENERSIIMTGAQEGNQEAQTSMDTCGFTRDDRPSDLRGTRLR
jgi:hypothetical protein